MILSTEALEKILGMKESVTLSAKEMTGNLNVTFYPIKNEALLSKEMLYFKGRLLEIFGQLKVNIVPYEEAFEFVPFRKRARRFFLLVLNNLSFITDKYILFSKESDKIFIGIEAMRGILKRYKIKNGISAIVFGENETGSLPIEKTSSFRHSSIITILDKPSTVSETTDFITHFDLAMSLFAYHMTNIVILVGPKDWVLYNFNASHPTFNYTSTFEKGILFGLIPKIVAPLKPYRLSDFEVLEKPFDVYDSHHARYTEDLVQSGNLLEKTGLYPKGKSISGLPFRNSFYLWIGKIHLDNRNGMSYGFLASQLPSEIPDLVAITTFENQENFSVPNDKDCFFIGENLFVVLDLFGDKFCMKVPEVWILSQRSGSDKTNINPTKDLVKLGIKNGKMLIQMPRDLKLKSSFRPSFDTGVILAHAVGNVIVAAISKHRKINEDFVDQLTERGLSLSHWHGYWNQNKIPNGWFMHGLQNPHVACSSPQSAIYAISGKFDSFEKALTDKCEFKGDIHVEPHHGINITFTSLSDLGKYLLEHPETTTLGNKYLAEILS